MDIWQFSRLVSQRLFAFNVINAGLGLVVGRRPGFWRGVGSQALGWAVVNMLIAAVGSFFTQRRMERLEQPYAHDVLHREAVTLRRLLWINTALDVVYMGGGLLLAATRGRRKSLVRGTGIGIVFQGMFLFWFDVLHAVRVPVSRVK